MKTLWREGPAVGLDEKMAAELAGIGYVDHAERTEVTSPEAAAALLMPLLAGRDRERTVLLHLDTKHRLLRTEELAVGSVDHTFMTPREVYRAALLVGATALVIAHNHPSGDPEPSGDDRRVTRRLKSAGEIVGIDLLDHVVVGGARWLSMSRRGLV